MSDIKEIFATVRTYCGMMFGDAKMQRCEEAKSVSEAAKQLGSGATHVAHCDKLRRAAFTLAEVLITLGIIGVVAALTLPTLIQNHQKQVYVTQLKHLVMLSIKWLLMKMLWTGNKQIAALV